MPRLDDDGKARLIGRFQGEWLHAKAAKRFKLTWEGRRGLKRISTTRDQLGNVPEALWAVRARAASRMMNSPVSFRTCCTDVPKRKLLVSEETEHRLQTHKQSARNVRRSVRIPRDGTYNEDSRGHQG